MQIKGKMRLFLMPIKMKRSDSTSVVRNKDHLE